MTHLTRHQGAAGRTGPEATAIAVRRRSGAVLAVVSLVSLLMFLWPLLVVDGAAAAETSQTPLVFGAVLILLVAVMGNELLSGEADAKSLALLGVLAGVAAALRPLGSGVSGFQPMFVILILGGRVLGPGLGFALGLVSMFGSALITGGVGPWLPFQMLGAAWVGMGAGLLPRCRGRAEVPLLAAYGAVSGLLYGVLLNLWFWPLLTSADTTVAFAPGAPLTENLGRFLTFSLLSSLGFDIPRAVGTIVLILLVGAPMLRVLRRTTRRAHFGAVARFTPHPDTAGQDAQPSKTGAAGPARSAAAAASTSARARSSAR